MSSLYSSAVEEASYWENLYHSVENPSHFSSYSALISWLAQDDTDGYQYIPDEFDCDDFALTLQQHALEDGYIISAQLVDTDQDFEYDHMMNIAVIGNSVYSIEPQNDQVLLLCHLD